MSLDYNKSFSLYRKAAELGEPHGVYGTGYCYYKGLGVKQDYCQALNYLSLGSEKGHSGCDMLLGNYYSHGYISDSPDFDKAQEFYSKAACRGNGWTLDIIKYGVLDSVKKIRKLQKTRWKNIRKEYFFDDTGLMRRIKSNGKYNISGSYVGTLYTYDWSGKYVEDEKSIVLNMAVKDSVMSFLCYTHDTLYTEFISDKYEHQMWKKTNMLKSERNMSFLPVNVTAEMTAVDTLVVSMEGMNPRNKEKARPMLAVLKKSFLSDVSHSITLENYSINVDFGEGGIDLAITADKKTSILIELYTIEGVKVFDVKKELSAGYNSFTIGATFSAGIYVLKINGKDFKYAKSLVYES